MEYRSNPETFSTLGDKIEDCMLSAGETVEFCKEFQASLSNIKGVLREVERLLRQKVDTIANDSYEVVNRSHRLIDNLLTELEDVETNRDSTIREEG
jgi:C4-type Zn-finger protein